MNTNKILIAAIAIILILQVIGLVTGNNVRLGGVTHYDQISTSDGYQVDDVTVIDGSGNFDGAVTGTSGTFSSTFDVTGETQLGDTIMGGGIKTIISTTTNSAETLVAADFCDYGVIKFSLAAGGSSDVAGIWNLPTSSDFIADCFESTASKYKDVVLWNYSTSTYAATFTQRAIASTALDIVTIVTSTDANGLPSLSAGQSALLRLWNQDNTTTGVTWFGLR